MAFNLLAMAQPTPQDIKQAVAAEDLVALNTWATRSQQRRPAFVAAVWRETMLRPAISNFRRYTLLTVTGAHNYACTSDALTREIARVIDPDFYVELASLSPCNWATTSRIMSREVAALILTRGIKITPEQMEKWWFVLPDPVRWDIACAQIARRFATGIMPIHTALNSASWRLVNELYAALPVEHRWRMRFLLGETARGGHFTDMAQQWPYIDLLFQGCKNLKWLADAPYGAMGWTLNERRIVADVSSLSVDVTAIENMTAFTTAKQCCCRDQMYALLLLCGDGYLAIKTESEDFLGENPPVDSPSLISTKSLACLINIWRGLSVDDQMMLLRVFGAPLPRTVGTNKTYLPTHALVWAYLSGA